MDWLLLLQIVVSVALIALVMLQSQGTGLGSSFGGSGVSYHSRKGLERYVFAATIGLTVLFTGLAVMSIML